MRTETMKTTIDLVAFTLDNQIGHLVNYHPDHGDVLVFVTGDIPMSWAPRDPSDTRSLTPEQLRAGKVQSATGMTFVWQDSYNNPVVREELQAAAEWGVRFVRIVPVDPFDEAEFKYEVREEELES